MAYNNGIITAPVSVYDVQRALGVGSPDVGTLCKHANINKWAKYKPVKYPGVAAVRSRVISACHLPFTPDPNFDKKTGLTVGSMIDFPSQVAGWSFVHIGYERPIGGANSPYRLTDFADYNHLAQIPCEILWSTAFKLDRGFSCTVNIYDRTSSADETLYISFSDIMNEVSGYSGFQNLDKRLCLAVYDQATSDTSPIWYFFSDKFSASVGSSGSWSVYCNMFNSTFTNLLTVGRTYMFKVMIVSNHPYLETIPSGDKYVWELGVSPSEMASMESGQNPIQAMCLALELNMDRTSIVLQNAAVISDLSYFLDILSVEKWGNVIAIGNYNILCTKLYMPDITVMAPHSIPLDGTAQYQLRALFNQGTAGTTIFRPTDKSGDNYYEIESTPSSTLGEINLTPWVTINQIVAAGGHSTETDSQGNQIDVYEFDFPNRTNVITSNTAAQTQGANGLFLFWDVAGTSFDVTFRLYYKQSANAQEILVRNRNLTVTYNVENEEGYIHDIEI